MPVAAEHSEEKSQRQLGAAAAKDCLACRVTGTVTCCGVGAYLALQTYAKPPASPLQRVMTLVLAGALGALGVARAFI